MFSFVVHLQCQLINKLLKNKKMETTTTTTKQEELESLLVGFFGNEKDASDKISYFLEKEGKLKNDLDSNLGLMNKDLNECHESDFDCVLGKWAEELLQ